MIELPQEHIEATYWLAERYRSITIKEIISMHNKIANDLNAQYDRTKQTFIWRNIRNGLDMFDYNLVKTIVESITRPDRYCVLCRSTLGCHNCIHAFSSESSFQACVLNGYKTMRCSQTPKELKRLMIARSKYLYSLLDMHHERREQQQ